VQPAVLGGISREFCFSPRIDNLFSTFCALESIIKSEADTPLENYECIRMVAMFDHEEIGSTSSHGADSAFLPEALRRILSDLHSSSAKDLPTAEVMSQCFAKSMLLSIDCAHACHPNYAEKHHDLHRPRMNKGVVIKFNGNQRYATTDLGIAVLRECARRVDVPLQEFMVRSDSPCGSTVGPLLAAKLGMRTADIGAPQLSMHSIREQCGTLDVVHMESLVCSFFANYSKIESTVTAE
jgi:aspartyl aminopeptidase